MAVSEIKFYQLIGWFSVTNNTRAPHAGANAGLWLHLENFKSKKGHNFAKKIKGLPPLQV